MKKICCVLLMALLCPFVLSAQTTVASGAGSGRNKSKGTKELKVLDPVKIDFTDTKKQTYQSIVPHNSSIDIIIENVNLKVVDTSASVKRETYNETVPKLFEAFSKTTLPDAGEASAGLKDRGTTLFSDNFKSGLTSQALKKQASDLDSRYIKLNNALNDRKENIGYYRDVIYHIKFLLQYQNDLLQKQSECNKKFEDIKNDVNLLTQGYFKDARMGTNSDDRTTISNNTDFDVNRNVITRHIFLLVNTEKETYDKLIALFATGTMNKLENDIKLFLQDVQKTSASLIHPHNSEEQRFLSELTINDQIRDLETSLQDMIYFYQQMDVGKLHADFSSFPIQGKNELLATYNFFDKGRFTKVVHLEFIKQDEVQVSINLTPKADAPCQVIPRHYDLTFRPKGKLKIDFSSGLFVNLGGHDFKDQSYRYENLAGNADSSVIRKNKGKNAIFPSIGALMHVYWRNGRDFRPAFTFGVSTKDLDRINYHLGGSLIFGYSQRFILSAGCTLTKATLIDDKYEVDQKVPKPDAGATVPTANFNRLGFFIAFTYNVSSK